MKKVLTWKMLILAGFFLFLAFAISASAQLKGNSDAIAIRVIPNKEHFSAFGWYKHQNFSGSPQSLLVDGYRAVRDGNTVYVNVGNVSGSTLYTNIYLITYNVNAGKSTVDIFGNILKNWRFNTNISNFGHCRKNNSIKCLQDSECQIKDFCDSPKARVIRDVIRLEDLSEIHSVLGGYRARGNYPILSAGTYLPNKTFSIWPSWKDNLKKDLGHALPVDPVNRFGKCSSASGFNADTCWDESRKIFSTDLPPKNPWTIPNSSLVYFYYTDSLGADFGLCAFFESGLAVSGGNLNAADCPQICMDFDGDGYGLYANGRCRFADVDCDDTNPLVNNSCSEICGNLLDDDSDFLADCIDPDCSAWPGCSQPVCNNNGVCNQGETNANCPDDCKCGNGICDAGECGICDIDCFCGNGKRSCGEECDDGNNINGDGCETDCRFTVFSCTDYDEDLYIKENTNVNNCGNVCGSGLQSCIGNNDCDDNNDKRFPNNLEICDGLDNDCDENIDEGFNAENCGFLCAFNYNPDRINNLRCCGNNANEGNPYEATEVSCGDGKDNDCDDLIDMADPDCSGNCGNTGENDWINAATPGDCNQCDFEGDNDGNQSVGNAFFWNNDSYSGMADKCDAACNIVKGATITWEKYEHGSELSCDGLDNDCDGEIDEGLKIVYYLDNDGDGYGDTSQPREFCTGAQDDKYVLDKDDCDDNNPDINPGKGEICNGIDDNCNGDIDEGCVMNTYCLDADNDGFGKSGSQVSAFAPPTADHILDSECKDCDDTKNYVKPGGTETCDGYNNDCDNETDEGCDDDGDGYCDKNMPWFSTCLLCEFTVSGPIGNDCDDTKAGVNPGIAEVCGNVIDDDCDGGIDEDCVNFCNFDFSLPCLLN